jgi:hypothetical protein
VRLLCREKITHASWGIHSTSHVFDCASDCRARERPSIKRAS